jgi:hypothetical protein
VFIWMLHMFHTDVANVLFGYCVCLQWFSSVLGVFKSVADACCKYFNCFECILQVLPLDIVKLDLVLLMLQWDPLAAAAGAPPSRRRRPGKWRPRGRERSPCGVGRCGWHQGARNGVQA